MNFVPRLLLLLLLALPAAAPPAEQHLTLQARLSAAARYQVPRGWTEEFVLNQGDPQSVITRDLHKIKIRLSGGRGSRYKSVDDFLAGFEARSVTGGTPPVTIDAVVVSGMRLPIYSISIAVWLPPPDTSGPGRYTRQEFCLVPAGKMFFVLSYSYGDSIPDPHYNGRKAWRHLVEGFRVLN